MTLIRAVVADDQPMARERLAALLAEQPDVQLIAQCASGAEAVAAIEQHRPDLVFLDMQMPELDGLAVVEAVGADRMPPVIFVTAYEQFAVRAFDVHALDYLLKPFARARFEQALDRARRQLAQRRTGDMAARLLALAQDLRAVRPAAERIVVRSGARVLFLTVDQVDWIEAEGNYARLHVGASSYLIREAMHSVEKRFGADSFVRIHRSRIVNLARVQELRLLPSGEYEVQLLDGTRLGVSRLHRDGLQERLKRT
jgi:two-component system LytT family response regulator